MKIELKSQRVGLGDISREYALRLDLQNSQFVQRAQARIAAINKRAVMMTEVLGLSPEFKYDVMAGINTSELLDSQLSMMVDGKLTRLNPEGIAALNFHHKIMGRTGGVTE